MQPFAVEYAHGSMAVAHNGNLVNAPELRRKLELDGSIFQSSSDTEVIIHLIARQREADIETRIVNALAPDRRRLLAGLPDRVEDHRRCAIRAASARCASGV